jgi:translocation and assembly module TamA
MAIALASGLEAQQADSVRVVVEIQGLTTPLERNVRATMLLEREAREGKLPARSIPHLYRRGESDIATALRPFGYYQPRVAKALEPGKDAWTAHYVVDPGPPVLVRTVRIDLAGEGAERNQFRQRVTGFPLQARDTMRDQLYEAGKLSFLTTASDSGYLDADFDTSVVLVNQGQGAADIRIRFRTGQRFQFGPVRFEQTILDEKVLRSAVTFREGQFYRQDKLLELQNQLSEYPYFSRVEVIPEREKAHGREVPVRVLLEPRPRWTYEFGGGYGTDTGPRGRVNGMWRWLNRQGHYGEAQVLASFTEQRLTGQYHIPAVLHRTGLLTLLAGYARTSVNPQGRFNPYDVASRTWTAGVRLSRKRIGWQEALSLSYQRASFEIGIDSARTALLIPAISWARTWSDSRILPRKGLRTRVELQASQKGILATASFFQLHASAKAIFGFAPRFRLITRGEVGQTFTSAFRSLPPNIRFFTGGDETVRGYRYLALAPVDSLGQVLGGKSLLVGSAEVDYQLMPRWLVAVFTDAGNAMDRLSLSGIRKSVGAGVRFVSPIGMIRLDGAFAMTKVPGSNRFRIHITMGPDL